ncbi:MAG: adenosylcobinamide-GDP ribazoletransferase [Spirochaetaceae bacterium]|nr:MAG: adenosylcobinamide-GDP ribazoletransferase [Spirochaetaceae bacterium]
MRELRVLLTAVVFFTRVPVPGKLLHDGDLLEEASRYLPFIGLVVGGVSAAVLWAAALILPTPVAVVLSMLAAVLMTGAFHEDGLADTVDGFGGGWTVERKLEIMKDSRLGTYGAIALLMSMLLRYVLILALIESGDMLQGLSVLVTTHIGARLAPVLVMGLLSYVRLDETSKVKPIAKSLSLASFIWAVLGAVLLSFGIGGFEALLRLILVLPTSALCALVFRKHIGGYTGDTLGASEQISELVLLGAALIL